MVAPGDIIAAMSPTASKRKFHLCVIGYNERGVAQFLFINSDYKFESDLRLADGEIENLPKSRSGETIISFSDIVLFTDKQLKLFQGATLGKATPEVIKKVIEHAGKVRTLNRAQRNQIIAALSALL